MENSHFTYDKDIEKAVACLRLEGELAPPEAIDSLVRVSKGEVSIEKVIADLEKQQWCSGDRQIRK